MHDDEQPLYIYFATQYTCVHTALKHTLMMKASRFLTHTHVVMQVAAAQCARVCYAGDHVLVLLRPSPPRRSLSVVSVRRYMTLYARALCHLTVDQRKLTEWIYRTAYGWAELRQ